METKIKFNYPSSEKVYLSGKLYPEIKVGMRRVKLTPTVTVEGNERHMEPNEPVYIYDTSGCLLYTSGYSLSSSTICIS